MKKKIIWLILTMMPWVTSAQLIDKLNVNRNEISITNQDGFDKIAFGNSAMEEVGRPEMPVVKRSFVIPADARVTGIEVIESERSRIAGTHLVYPVQPPMTTVERNGHALVREDSVYRSEAGFPGEAAIVSFDGMIQGFHVVTVSYYPVVYLPAQRELYSRNIEVAINYQTGNPVEPAAPISYYRANLAKQFVRSMVQNSADVDRYSDVFQVIPQRTCLNPKAQSPKQRSIHSPEDIVPDYIIITSYDLRESFQKLADWKTKKGIPTLIQSVEEINFEYPGGDLQEKIRNYLLNVRKRWNAAGMYILFGGDASIIPVRSYSTAEGMQVSDAYYVSDSISWMCMHHQLILQKLGETPFISGRILVKNKTEADHFIRKIISYEKASETDVDYNYLNNSLISDAFMDKKNGKPTSGYMKQLYDFCQGRPARFWYLFDHFNCTKDDHILKAPYHADRGLELNRNNLLSVLKNDKAAIDERFHFVYHMDHSVPTSLGSSVLDKEESLSINDVKGASFAPKYYQVIMSSGCHPADFSRNCIAEQLLNQVDAGAVAFLGNTDVGLWGECHLLDSLYRNLYMSGPTAYGQFGMGYLRLKITGNGGYRLRNHLLGDPEMPLWTCKPSNLFVSAYPQTIQNEPTEITVSVMGIRPNRQAMICLMKGDEAYATRIVDSDGLYNFTFTPVTSGKIDVTVTSQDCRPYETQVTVNAGLPTVRVANVMLNDEATGGGNGNGDGRLDAGETVKMKIALRNSGTQSLDIRSCVLSCSSEYIDLHQTNLDFSTINSGAMRTSANEVLFTIHPDIGGTQIMKNDLNPILFNLKMKDQSGNDYVDTFKIEVYAPELELREQKTSGRLGAGTTNRLLVTLINTGKSETGRLTATISPEGVSSNVAGCTLPTSYYESMIPKVTSINAKPFEFQIGSQYSATNNSLSMKLEVTNEYGRTWTFIIDPNDKGPEIPDNSMKFVPREDAIELYWWSNSEKYNIYRSVGSSIGRYEKLNRYPLTSAFYIDEGVSLGTIYYYKIAAVSPSGNEGFLSAPLKASPSLPLMKGFPKYMPDSRDVRGSVCVADVDNDGKKELFYTQRNFNKGREGFLMGFRSNGEELFDIDNNPSSVSGFAQLSATVWATPVIGDLSGDGEQKIIVLTRNEEPGTTLNSVTCFTAWDHNGDNRPDEVWRRQPEGQFYRGAVVSNLDNSSDGSLEILLRDDGRNPIRILDAKGILKCSFGEGGYTMPAVADLDGDGDKEIIVSSIDKINIWNHNGTAFTRNPFFTVGEKSDSCCSSPVVCDLDKDGKKEIVFMVKRTSGRYLKHSTVCVLKPDGTPLPGWDGSQFVNTYPRLIMSELSVGDIDRDGKPEVIALGVSMLRVWKSDGTLLFSKEIELSVPDRISAVVADVNGDTYPEIVFGAGNRIYAVDRFGNDIPGFPLVTDNKFVAPVYVGDIDQDGNSEVVAVDGGNIYAWKTRGNPNLVEWGSDRHDQWNTGEYAPVCEPKLIRGMQVWNGVTPCGDVLIQSGKFTVPAGKNLILQKNSKIIVRPGAAFEIDGGIVSNAFILALPGSTVTIKGGGTVYLRTGGYLDIRQGALFDFQSGTLN